MINDINDFTTLGQVLANPKVIDLDLRVRLPLQVHHIIINQNLPVAVSRRQSDAV